jgi:hypothetical protein
MHGIESALLLFEPISAKFVGIISQITAKALCLLPNNREWGRRNQDWIVISYLHVSETSVSAICKLAFL